MDTNDIDELYDGYEESFLKSGRARRRQKRREDKLPSVTDQELLDLVDREDDPSRFDPTYLREKKEDNQERLWLIQHLQGFYEEEYITDVLYNVKGGKEASVYCCPAHPSLGVAEVAAKVYRPAIFRSLKNDALYREGRLVSRESGQRGEVVLDGRVARAVARRTGFGKAVLMDSWIGKEYQMMRRLYEHGVHLPEPIGHKGMAILMAYLGQGHQAAPPLHYVTLDQHEAQPLFDQLLADVEQMLALDCIHGDFSAYNILYWQGQVFIIDFPQAVNPQYNPSALTLLERDITRLCQYFARYRVQGPGGRPPDPVALSLEMWTRYLHNAL